MKRGQYTRAGVEEKQNMQSSQAKHIELYISIAEKLVKRLNLNEERLRDKSKRRGNPQKVDSMPLTGLLEKRRTFHEGPGKKIALTAIETRHYPKKLAGKKPTWASPKNP